MRICCRSEAEAHRVLNALRAAESALWEKSVLVRGDTARFAEVSEHRYLVRALAEGVTVVEDEEEENLTF
jgi:hypothetical protein